MNSEIANRMPWKAAFHDVWPGSKTASVLPLAPPRAMIATAITRNGTSDTAAVATIARIPILTPT